MSPDGLRQAQEKMRAAGVPEPAVRVFARSYRHLLEGQSGQLGDSQLSPADGLVGLEELARPGPGITRTLDRVVAIKLNGGLGTTMGLSTAKSLIEVKGGLTFLDVIARQILALRRRHDVRLPLVLLDSFATREDTLAALASYDLAVDLPLDFLQHREPKIAAAGLEPVSWAPDPRLEWCPPGHGDVYSALQTSGLLEALLARDYRWAFLSNSDNLGATVDPRILAFIEAEEAPFVMEVVEGTEAERKGGHIARNRDGTLVLRETAQVPPQDEASFRDFRRWRYYNTNNLWVDLRCLAALLEAGDGVLELPVIVNRKTVDPRDPSTPEVFQLETAMGAAIGTFPGALALRVPRARFAPVKSTDDLLVLRSDAYLLDEQGRVTPAPELEGHPPLVSLDPRFYKLLADFEARFPAGAPSLVSAQRLTVHGDVSFERDVVVRGAVTLDAPESGMRVPAGSVLGTD